MVVIDNLKVWQFCKLEYKFTANSSNVNSGDMRIQRSAISEGSIKNQGDQTSSGGKILKFVELIILAELTTLKSLQDSTEYVKPIIFTCQ